MLIEIFYVVVILILILLAFIASQVNRQLLGNSRYYELTVFLGSGGHTGEMFEMLKNFDFRKVDKINLLVGHSDRSSEQFFMGSLKKELS